MLMFLFGLFPYCDILRSNTSAARQSEQITDLFRTRRGTALHRLIRSVYRRIVPALQGTLAVQFCFNLTPTISKVSWILPLSCSADRPSGSSTRRRHSCIGKIDTLQQPPIVGAIDNRSRLCQQFAEVHRQYRRNRIFARLFQFRKLNERS